MYVIEPLKVTEGHWVMIVRTMSPTSGPFSVCVDPKTMEACEGHHTTIAARGCSHARYWGKRIESHGELVIEDLKPKSEE